MAETRSEGEERALPAKRKPDLTCSNADDDPLTKTPKTADKINGDCHADGGAEAVRAEDNGAAETEVADASGTPAADLDEEEEEDDEEEDVQDHGFDEDDEEDDEEYVDEEDVEEDGERAVDVKGKGVLKDHKGKGKLIVDDNGSDSDDSDDADPSNSDGGVQSGSDSDLSDDPLAEVDLDNILPSRTRQRSAQSGVVIADNRRSTDGSGGGGNA